MNTADSRKSRLGFGILCGCLSVLFAEVFLGSYSAAFTSIWGWIGVLPIYALYILLLLSVAFSRGLPNLRTLYFLGAILGLYEAYLTKQLWVNSWGDLQLHFAGVSWFAVLALVFYWHPLMAFILPAFATELLLTTTPAEQSIVPARWRARFESPRSKAQLAVVLGALLGLNQAGQSPQPFASLRGLPDALLLVAAVWWWQRKRPHCTLQEMLPSRRACWVMAGLLVVFVVLVGGDLRVEFFPGALGQVVILGLYAVLAGLAWMAMRAQAPTAVVPPSDAPLMPARYLAYLVLACFGTSAVVQAVLPAARVPLFALFLIAGMLAGIWILVVNVLRVFASRKRAVLPAAPGR